MKNLETPNPEKDPRITKILIQALADLHYPKIVRDSMNYDEAKTIIENQAIYNPAQETTSGDKENEPETKTESKPIIPKYEGLLQHQAAYELDLDTLQRFDWDALESKNKNGETPLHLVVMMAFQNFTKAEEIIRFLKRKEIDFNLKDNNGLTPLDIAQQRAALTPGYQSIAAVLEE